MYPYLKPTTFFCTSDNLISPAVAADGALSMRILALVWHGVLKIQSVQLPVDVNLHAAAILLMGFAPALNVTDTTFFPLRYSYGTYVVPLSSLDSR